MKILKIILIVLLILIAIPLVAAIFVPKDYYVEREVTINKPHQEVYSYVRLLRNQDNFSTWSSRDPAMKKSYTGSDGEVGFIAAWESENPDVGVGEQEIIAIEEGRRIDYALRFKEPFEASDRAHMEFEELGANQTKVIWGFEGHMDYPMNAMLLFIDMESLLGNDFESGLQQLKEILE
ncbi:Polyketide cyclase / dehydrase and lipid transport [Cyclobacterium lianum]|uniref:Polyketide cyclase / dehydrase and lipid transport n=1 Tax=Cyclobacterium lianum TaxID=388280 RepID=A0A1M7QA88_9BACT|nr:SRPBCC family protein [Cyclobacterium lianum]SHN27409.1 Polyketide cyclase / dehydrase and lipid transport [Cyclobacterium lianum]